MNDTNEVILTGRTGGDLELRYSPKGMAIGQLSLAVNEAWTGDDGQKRERVHWVNVTVFDKTAESCAKWVGKGSQILIQGKLVFDQWDDKQTGKKRSALKVTAHRVQFLDTKPPGGQQAQPQPQRQQRHPANSPPAGEAPQGDDVPF